MKEDDKSVPDALTREMVQRTTLRLNVTQEVIVITDDKAYQCLHQWRDKIESRKAWIAPVSLLTPLVLAFATPISEIPLVCPRTHGKQSSF